MMIDEESRFFSLRAGWTLASTLGGCKPSPHSALSDANKTQMLSIRFNFYKLVSRLLNTRVHLNTPFLPLAVISALNKNYF